MNVADIRKIAIIGAGVMGPGIAEVFAIFGAHDDYEISLYDISSDALKSADRKIRSDLEKVASTGLYSEEDLKKAKQRITLEQDLTNAVSTTQLVIEAVPEKMELKMKIFKDLDRLAPPTAILATNSSGLSVTEIASVIKRPELCIGTHFMNPPLMMPLVEIVKGEKTGPETVQVINELLAGVGKKPVIIKKDVEGYVHNRMQAALFREAMYLLDNDVISVEDLETTIQYGLGLRLPVMKVFEMVDLMGIDTIKNVLTYLYPKLSRSIEPPGILDGMIKEGNLGLKSGKGFHDYSQRNIQEAMNQREAATFQLLMLLRQFE
ncbi:MAG: 3-hydroxyacyl-CoA dehydrogenase family protein [Candidatus Odinarchaeota archaeon]